MANPTAATKPYALEALVPVPPPRGARSSRWTARRRTLGTYSSLSAAKAAAARYQQAHGVQEGLRVSKSGRGVWSWYQFHGPLGYMDRGYRDNLVAHANDCPKCEAIRAARELLWPGKMPWDPELRALTWEQKEAMAACAPHAPEHAGRYARMGWR